MTKAYYGVAEGVATSYENGKITLTTKKFFEKSKIAARKGSLFRVLNRVLNNASGSLWRIAIKLNPTFVQTNKKIFRYCVFGEDAVLL